MIGPFQALSGQAGGEKQYKSRQKAEGMQNTGKHRQFKSAKEVHVVHVGAESRVKRDVHLHGGATSDLHLLYKVAPGMNFFSVDCPGLFILPGF